MFNYSIVSLMCTVQRMEIFAGNYGLHTDRWQIKGKFEDCFHTGGMIWWVLNLNAIAFAMITLPEYKSTPSKNGGNPINDSSIE